MAAYEYFLKGMELQSAKMKEGLPRARSMFQKALDLDPGYARAQAALGHTLLMEWMFGINQDPALLDQIRNMAEAAIAMDPKESAGYALLGHAYLWTHHHDKALVQIRKAISLGPGNAEWIASLGEQLTWSGQPEEGIPYLEQALRLDPNYPAWYLWYLGHARFLTNEFDRAADIFQRTLVKDPNFWPAHAYLALAYDALGKKNGWSLKSGRPATSPSISRAWPGNPACLTGTGSWLRRLWDGSRRWASNRSCL